MRSVVTAVALSLALGCGAESTPPEKKVDPGKPAPSTSPPAKPIDEPKSQAPTPAAEFFAAVIAGKANPDQLTAEFKMLIAPPLEPSDAAKGYSDATAREFLKSWAATKADTPTGGVVGDVAFAASKPGPEGRVLLRLAKDGGAWKADWLSKGPPTASEVSLTGGDDTVAILFAVAAFSDAALKKEYTLAAGLMTPAGRKAVAPPFDADQALGYNRNILKQRLAAAVGKSDRATMANQAKTGDAATVKLALTGDPTRTELTLRLVKGPKPGVWLVDGFDGR